MEPRRYDSSDDDYMYLSVVRCRGVVVGDHNRQINALVYRIEKPRIDLAAVLAKQHVRDALVALAQADRSSYQARRRDAQQALTDGAPWRLVGQSLIELHPNARAEQPALDSTLHMLHQAIFIKDCQGVQSGDHNTQHNEFYYVCRDASIDAIRLLSNNPDLASALIDHVVGDGSGGAITTALSDSIDRNVVLSGLPGQQNVEWNSHSCGLMFHREVADHDGVMVGRDNSLTTYARTRSVLDDSPTSLGRSWAAMRSDIADAATADVADRGEVGRDPDPPWIRPLGASRQVPEPTPQLEPDEELQPGIYPDLWDGGAPDLW